MGDLTERCAVLERKRADLYMRHTGLLEETGGGGGMLPPLTAAHKTK